MQLEFPVTPEMYKQYISFHKGERTHVIFQPIGTTKDVYILCHGDEETMGNVVINGYSLTLTELGECLIPRFKNKYDNIYTISCFGGYQPVVDVMGTCIRSCHSAKRVVHVWCNQDLDDDYYLNVDAV